VPGDVDESLILEALRHDGLEMPPDMRLPDRVIANFETWIARGAPDPRDGTTPAVASTAGTDDFRSTLPHRHRLARSNEAVTAGFVCGTYDAADSVRLKLGRCVTPTGRVGAGEIRISFHDRKNDYPDRGPLEYPYGQNGMQRDPL